MFPTRVQCAKKNLLLCFDAFGTLFSPNTPIPRAYAEAAIKHGVRIDDKSPESDVGREFKAAFKEASKESPNYGKAVGLGAEKWWSKVINNTFKRWLEPGQDVPQTLVNELLQRYSTKEGYDIYPDVIPFFQKLRNKSLSETKKPWPWEKTVVGIITNSDDRVPGILGSFGLKIGPRRVGTPDQRTAETALEDDISFVVLSYDVGIEKPNYAIFDAALDSLKETLSERHDGLQVEDFEKVYVGDEIKNDFFGARRAGWDAVLLDRDGRFKSKFEEEGRNLVIARVKEDGEDGEKQSEGVYVASGLEALNDWYPGSRRR